MDNWLDKIRNAYTELLVSRSKKNWRSNTVVQALTVMNQLPRIQLLSGNHELDYNSKVVFYDNENNCINIISGFYTLGTMNRQLTQALLNCFDHSRAYIDQNNLEHQSCIAIRGYNLSGEMEMSREWWRTFFTEMRDRKRLLIRDAVIKDIGSETAVDAVFEKCYSDYTPFTVAPEIDTRHRKSQFYFT